MYIAVLTFMLITGQVMAYKDKNPVDTLKACEDRLLEMQQVVVAAAHAQAVIIIYIEPQCEEQGTRL